MRVAVDLGQHMGDVQAVGQRQRLGIDLAAADDADFVDAAHAAPAHRRQLDRASSEFATSMPSARQALSRVTTMFSLPGSGRPMPS